MYDTTEINAKLYNCKSAGGKKGATGDAEGLGGNRRSWMIEES